MNDAERDAWLREALRHAPDSDAVPPSGVSEAILLKARAAARAATRAPRRAGARAAPANAFAAFWAWLARPQVAAGFASVMAATLVGLMWWDRPMDETMPRPPAMSNDRAAAAPPLVGTAPPPAAPTNAAADDGAVRRRQRSGQEQFASDAKVAEPATLPAKRKVDPLTKERALPAEAKNEAPAPFPSTEAQRETTTATRKSIDAPAIDATKKNDEALRSRAADAVDRATAPMAQSVAPASPAPARPAAPAVTATPAPTSPLASGRVAADEGRPTGAMQSESAIAKSAAGAVPAPAARTASAPRELAAAPFGERAQRQRASSDLRDKDAAGVGSPAPAPSAAPFRNELERARPEAAKSADALTRTESTLRADASTRVAPLARVLAAIAADPEQWSRQTAGGDTLALDAGWRAWLGELDVAATGRWRPLATVGAAADVEAGSARDGASTLRLVSAGRVAAVVRIDGAMVQVDATPGSGADRWQATLSPAGAERLRTLARRLPP